MDQDNEKIRGGSRNRGKDRWIMAEAGIGASGSEAGAGVWGAVCKKKCLARQKYSLAHHTFNQIFYSQ